MAFGPTRRRSGRQKKVLITLEQLSAISPGTPVERIKSFIDHINEYCPMYGIDTKIELASFLSQVLHETGGLKWLREIWGPTQAQLRYEGRKDLGNLYPGDGKRFLGRGLIHITGRSMYGLISKLMFKGTDYPEDSLLKNPDLLCSPRYAVLSACIYWKHKNLDSVDDDLSIKEDTKIVNGGYNGLEDRQAIMKRCIDVFGIT